MIYNNSHFTHVSVGQLECSWFKQSCASFQAVCWIKICFMWLFSSSDQPSFEGCSSYGEMQVPEKQAQHTFWAFAYSIFHFLKPNIKYEEKNALHCSQLEGSECWLSTNLMHTTTTTTAALIPQVHMACACQVLSKQRFLSSFNANHSVFYFLSGIYLGSLSLLVQFPKQSCIYLFI